MLELLLGRNTPAVQRIKAYTGVGVLGLAVIQIPNWYPGLVSYFNSALAQYSPWQLVFGVATVGYITRNAITLLGLNSLEPAGSKYKPSWFRAMHFAAAITCSVDTAANLPTSFLRALAVPPLLLYYVFVPSAAIERTRQLTGHQETSRMRRFFTAAQSPFIILLGKLAGVSSVRLHKVINLESIYRENTGELGLPALSNGQFLPDCHIFFNGTDVGLQQCSKLIFHIHGGGFMGMSPASHDDYLALYAKRTGAVIVSPDYSKAPEYPYPTAADQIWHLYRLVAASNGFCLGMNINSEKLRIIVTGDSAGGCLTVSLTSRIIEHNMSATESKNTVMEPVATVPVYPSLDFNGGIVVNPRDYKYFGTSSDSTSAHGAAIMSSYSARFDDRMISAPMTDVVSVIYGSSALHNVKNEYRLAPLHTPDTILEKWTIPSLFLVGELDIFVDHSVIFSGKLREAQRRARSRQATDQEVVHCSVSDADTQTVVLSGISHGFLSLSSVYPEAFAIIEFIGRYMADAFHNASEVDSQVKMSMTAPSVNSREEVLAKLDLVQDNLLIKRKMHFDAVINN